MSVFAKLKNMTKDKKSVLIRVVLFFLAIIVAITAITVGVMNLRPKTGWREIDTKLNASFPLDGNEVSLFYYLDESDGTAISQKNSSLSQILSDSLKEIYEFSDAYDDYSLTGRVNLGYINNHYNESITLNDTMYEMLKDAYLKTCEENSNYSIFAGPIFRSWNAILAASLLDNNFEITDPINKENGIASNLLSIYSLISSKDECDINFDDENKSIKVNVSDNLLSILDEGDVLLDFNILKDAYCLEYIKDRINYYGYFNGYLTINNTYFLSLGDYYGNGSYSLNMLGKDIDNNVVVSTVIESKKQVCSVQFKNFAATTDENDSYYSFTSNGKTYYRNPYLDLSIQEPNNEITSNFLVANNKKLYDLAYIACNSLSMSTTNLKETIKNTTDISWALVLNEQSNVIIGNMDNVEVFANFTYSKI